MFETHVTVEGLADGLAARHGLRLTHVVLASGAFPSQQLLTHRETHPSDDEAIAAALALARVLAEDVRIRRLKVEKDLAHAMRGLYIEQHVKVVCSDDRVDMLRAIASEHNAHLSRNAFTASQRFLTQRFAADARTDSERSLSALTNALSGFRVVDVEREMVIFDSNAELDAGWTHD